MTPRAKSFLVWLARHPNIVAIRIHRRSADPDRLSPDCRLIFQAAGPDRSTVTRAISYSSYSNLVDLGCVNDVVSILAPGAARHLPKGVTPVPTSDPSRPRRKVRAGPSRDRVYEGRDL